MKGLEENLNKNNNKGCFSAILGTLAVIGGVLLYAVIASLVSNLFISLRFGDDAACALLSLSFAGIIAAFIAFDIVFVVWQLKLARGDDAGLDKIFKLTLIICLCAVLLLPIVSANTFTRLDDSSVSKVFFAEYKSYDIEKDMSRATLACNEGGSLTYTLTMSDGEKIELLSSVNSCSDAFIEKYENLYGYAAYLTEKLSDNGISLRVIGEEHMEESYKDAHPEVWKYLEKMIEESK